MSAAIKLRAGDRIVGTNYFNRGMPGVVVKPCPKTVVVRYDHKSEDTREDRDSIRSETAEDIAEREREQLLADWHAARPRTSLAIVQTAGYSSIVTGVSAYGLLRTPEEMRAAAAELHALAAWFEKRPVSP